MNEAGNEQVICAETVPVGNPSGWQPIETAPRDGTNVLICDAHDRDVVAAAYWSSGRKQWHVLWNAENFEENFTATHWMLLPEPPK